MKTENAPEEAAWAGLARDSATGAVAVVVVDDGVADAAGAAGSAAGARAVIDGLRAGA